MFIKKKILIFWSAVATLFLRWLFPSPFFSLAPALCHCLSRFHFPFSVFPLSNPKQNTPKLSLTRSLILSPIPLSRRISLPCARLPSLSVSHSLPCNPSSLTVSLSPAQAIPSLLYPLHSPPSLSLSHRLSLPLRTPSLSRHLHHLVDPPLLSPCAVIKLRRGSIRKSQDSLQARRCSSSLIFFFSFLSHVYGFFFSFLSHVRDSLQVRLGPAIWFIFSCSFTFDN